jgi:hypothetical protein
MLHLDRVLSASIAGLLLLLPASCDAEPPHPDQPLLEAGWQEVALPIPPGPGNRIILRESVHCGGKWYLVGGIGDPSVTGDYGMETRPAVWVSEDGSTWGNMRLTPRDYYGERVVFYSAGCREGKIAVIGSKTGGAHGNPRINTWYQQDDGSLNQVLADFELYNGPNFMNVSRIVAGPDSWLIAGNRMPGATVWLSPAATAFRIVEGAPELASDPRGETWAADAVATPQGWLVVGGMLFRGRTDRDPMSFTSKDGVSWARTVVTATPEYEEFQRVTASNGVVWAAGVRGSTFGVWRYAGGKWELTGEFGDLTGGSAAPAVKSLISHGTGLIMAGGTGSAHEIWASRDGRSWRQVALPAPTPVGAERTISINDHDQRILMVIDDGQRGRAWFGAVSVTF